jgi:hypothetical protein
MTLSSESSDGGRTSRLANKTRHSKRGQFYQDEKVKKSKNWMKVFILLVDISRYFRFKDAKQLPSEITPDRTVGTRPRSLAVPVVHY